MLTMSIRRPRPLPPDWPAAVRAAARASCSRGFSPLSPACDVCGLDLSFANSGDGPGRIRDPVRRLRGGGPGPGRGISLPAAILVARTVVGPAHPAGDARAVAPAQGLLIALQYHHDAAEGRVETGRPPVTGGRPHRRGLVVPAVATLAAACRPDLPRHLADRAQGLEGGVDRKARRTWSAAAPVDLPARAAWDQPAKRMSGNSAASLSRPHRPRRGGAGLHGRVGAARRRIRPRLLGLCAGAPRRRQCRGGQSRFRARRPAGPEVAPGRAGRRYGLRWSASCAGPNRAACSRRPTARNAISGLSAITWPLRPRKRWGPVAPFFIDQEAPLPPGGLPKAGRVTPHLPNNHLQYALTWYGLALVLIVAFLVWTRSRRSGCEAALDQDAGQVGSEHLHRVLICVV